MGALDYALAEIAAVREQFMVARVAELMSGGDMSQADALIAAAEEWEPTLEASAPKCYDCDFIGPEQRDPFGTGDSPTMRECTLLACPWEKSQ